MKRRIIKIRNFLRKKKKEGVRKVVSGGLVNFLVSFFCFEEEGNLKQPWGTWRL